jgi:polyvinyl alcohol dehydrogenase (cytochrome)
VFAVGWLLPVAAGIALAQTPPDWPMAGQGLSNTRHQPGETAIGPHNAARLQPKWAFTTGGDGSATPAVADGAVYLPDWAGNLFKVDAATGALLWQTAAPRNGVLTGPVTLANGVLYGGSMARRGRNMFALDAATGRVLWTFASGGSVNSGPAVAGGVVYWPSGYSKLGLGKRNDKLYAFEVAP